MEIRKGAEEDGDEVEEERKVEEGNKMNEERDLVFEREVEDSVSLMEKKDLNVKNVVGTENSTEILSGMPTADQTQMGGLMPGKFYFEDMLSEYEKTIDRNNNEKVENLIKAKGKNLF